LTDIVQTADATVILVRQRSNDGTNNQLFKEIELNRRTYTSLVNSIAKEFGVPSESITQIIRAGDVLVISDRQVEQLDASCKLEFSSDALATRTSSLGSSRSPSNKMAELLGSTNASPEADFHLHPPPHHQPSPQQASSSMDEITFTIDDNQ
jgi:hypothetical protein